MKIKITINDLSHIFWEQISRSLVGDLESQLTALSSAALDAERLRPLAKYNTGSVSLTTMLFIAEIAKLSMPRVSVEVGTFIGNTTTALGNGLQRISESRSADNERYIFSCDFSNDIKLPWNFAATLQQFPLSGSTDMLQELTRRKIPVDLFLIDGRLSPSDASLMSVAASKESIILLDDFVGIEKGVANAQLLLSTEKFSNYTLIYPPKHSPIQRLDLASCSLAALVPPSTFVFSRQ